MNVKSKIVALLAEPIDQQFDKNTVPREIVKEKLFINGNISLEDSKDTKQINKSPGNEIKQINKSVDKDTKQINKYDGNKSDTLMKKRNSSIISDKCNTDLKAKAFLNTMDSENVTSQVSKKIKPNSRFYRKILNHMDNDLDKKEIALFRTDCNSDEKILSAFKMSSGLMFPAFTIPVISSMEQIHLIITNAKNTEKNIKQEEIDALEKLKNISALLNTDIKKEPFESVHKNENTNAFNISDPNNTNIEEIVIEDDEIENLLLDAEKIFEESERNIKIGLYQNYSKSSKADMDNAFKNRTDSIYAFDLKEKDSVISGNGPPKYNASLDSNEKPESRREKAIIQDTEITQPYQTPRKATSILENTMASIDSVTSVSYNNKLNIHSPNNKTRKLKRKTKNKTKDIIEKKERKNVDNSTIEMTTAKKEDYMENRNKINVIEKNNPNEILMTTANVHESKDVSDEDEIDDELLQNFLDTKSQEKLDSKVQKSNSSSKNHLQKNKIKNCQIENNKDLSMQFIIADLRRQNEDLRKENHILKRNGEILEDLRNSVAKKIRQLENNCKNANAELEYERNMNKNFTRT